jgi:hypothetical protein
MIILLWFALSAAIIGLVVHVARQQCLRRNPKELRGDWWPRFEAEFREYVSAWEGAAHVPRQDVHSRSRPPTSN